MKKIIVFLAIFILIIAVYFLKAGKKENCLVKINNYCITMQEFEAEFKDSAYAKNDTPDARREFLNTLIKRKLMLQDAERRGLDKDKEFLKAIERFWEQSLLKRSVSQKIQEISGSISVSEQAIEEEYKKMQKEGKADKPYGQMYDQIKWTLTRLQESQALDKWIAQLYNNADIKTNGPYTLKINDKNIITMVGEDVK